MNKQRLKHVQRSAFEQRSVCRDSCDWFNHRCVHAVVRPPELNENGSGQIHSLNWVTYEGFNTSLLLNINSWSASTEGLVADVRRNTTATLYNRHTPPKGTHMLQCKWNHQKQNHHTHAGENSHMSKYT